MDTITSYELDVERPIPGGGLRDVERQREAVRRGAEDAKIGDVGRRADLQLRCVQLGQIYEEGRRREVKVGDVPALTRFGEMLIGSAFAGRQNEDASTMRVITVRSQELLSSSAIMADGSGYI
jgi:hypothetical protein